MRILIVEDDENTIALFEEELPSTASRTTVFARSRDSAMATLNVNTFDLVVLDLKIPAQDGSLDSDVSHGLAVRAHVQQIGPGTPVVVFSAFGTVSIVSRLLEASAQRDVWGSGQEQPMTRSMEKSELAACLAYIELVSEHVDVLSEINVSTGGEQLHLTEGQKRILRVFSRMNQGVNARVSGLGGGLSGAKTVRVEVGDQNAAITTVAVAKLGRINDLQDEESRYNRCIAPSLAVGGFAHLIRFVQAGAADTGGIFYGFAGNYQRTLIELVQTDPDRAAAIVPALQGLESTWQTNAINKSIRISEIRQGLISDDLFLSLASSLGFDWRAFEQQQVQIKWCCQHRDLHGMNVLTRDGGIPLLIDYGEVEPAPACLDALVLELSLLFHPGCKHVRGTWPTNDQALVWQDLDSYVGDSPIGAFVRACRTWAFAAEPLDKAVYATAYAYAVRQLKFVGTDHDLARSIASAAQAAFATD